MFPFPPLVFDLFTSIGIISVLQRVYSNNSARACLEGFFLWQHGLVMMNRDYGTHIIGPAVLFVTIADFQINTCTIPPWLIGYQPVVFICR